MYQLSREDKAAEMGKFEHHYNIAFILVALATFGPYIIQYSSMMNAIYHKGYF